MKIEWIESSNGPLAATRLGQGGSLIVAIHGWTCRRSHFAAQLSLMSDFGEVLAIDLPGHGDSLTSKPSVASIAGLAQTLAEVLKSEQKGRQLILIGHSMGGAIALEAARLLENVRVVLIDTFVIPYGDLTEEVAVSIEQVFCADFVHAMKNLVETNTREDLAVAIKSQLFHDMASANTAWALPLWGDLLRWQPDSALQHSSGNIYAINGALLPEVARTRCAPYLIQEIVLQEAKHFPQLELVDEFNLALSEVLTKLAKCT